MKTERNILIAFVLNFAFSIFEIIGGVFTNSISIISDAIHDIGDSISIGVSFILEKISKKNPDEKYTYGYIRYSVLGSLITSIILIVGGIFVIIHAIERLKAPVEINYNGMILIAVIGTIVNLIATLVTKKDGSLNQKAVSLHMLEDVLGWIVVLIGALVIKVTKINNIDSIISICVSLFILLSALKNIKIIINLFLEKTPNNISLSEIRKHILEIKNIIDVHHIHVWSIDGYKNYATMHIVTNKESFELKKEIKEELHEFGIVHATIEFEKENENCNEMECKNEISHTHHGHSH